MGGILARNFAKLKCIFTITRNKMAINLPERSGGKSKSQHEENDALVNEKKSSAKDTTLRKGLIYPMVLILFSGFVGILIANFWEYFKFKREVLFEQQIEYLTDNRREVNDLYISIDGLIRTIRSQEKSNNAIGIDCGIQNFRNPIENLKAQTLKVSYVNEFSEGIMSNDSVMYYSNEFKSGVARYIECLEKRQKCDCSVRNNNMMLPLKKVIYSYTTELKNKLYEEVPLFP